MESPSKYGTRTLVETAHFCSGMKKLDAELTLEIGRNEAAKVNVQKLLTDLRNKRESWVPIVEVTSRLETLLAELEWPKPENLKGQKT
jgi:hypothetical protein